jgi:hypothetical protein
MEYLKFTPELANDWKNALNSTETSMPYVFKRVMDSLNSSQLQSKLWLIEELNWLEIKPTNVCLIAGWYAQYVVPLLLDTFPSIQLIENFEIDKDIREMTYRFNKRFKDEDKYRVVIKNIMFKELSKEQDFDLVINCACEHMFPMWKFREINEEQDPVYVLQSSDDDTHDDHINCVQSTDELIEQARIVDVLYSGSIKLHNGTTRFMVIGQ